MKYIFKLSTPFMLKPTKETGIDSMEQPDFSESVCCNLSAKIHNVQSSSEW